MSVEKMKKQLQLQKFEASKLEIDIKIAERMEDIDRLKMLSSEWQENIDKMKLEIKNIRE